MTTGEEAASVIDDFVGRGVFRAVPEVPARGELAAWQVRWFAGHTMRFAVSGQSAWVDAVLPPLSSRLKIYRDLRDWLRAQQSDALPAHRRLDPETFRLDVRNRAGLVRIRVQAGAVPAATRVRRLVQLVNALYFDFLNGPGRLEWVVEAFALDPDNPRLA
jgi:hypothetical protein